jgi:hypothetical protein
MDPRHYYNIYNYLTNKIIPSEFSTKQIEQLQRQSGNFIIKYENLYKKDYKNPEKLYRVITKEETPLVLYMYHNDPTSGHLGIETTFNKIREKYYWPQFYEDIKSYVKACDACQRRGRPARNNLLHPIPVYSPFYQIGIDIVGPLNRTQRGKRYIVVAMDYLTKWPEARAISEATAENVAKFIYEQIICQHGCPQIILTDRGTHFNNNMLDRLMEKFEVKHLLSTPYHPQTNGLVERFNRTLCESLAKLESRTNDWDLFIAPVLFAYRTTKHSTTKISPFQLVYGRSARLPLDMPNEENLNALNDHLSYLVEDIPQIRKKARDQIAQSQLTQKDRHDKRIKKESYFISETRFFISKLHKIKHIPTN